MTDQKTTDELRRITKRLEIARAFAAIPKEDGEGVDTNDWYARDVAFLLAGSPYGAEGAATKI